MILSVSMFFCMFQFTLPRGERLGCWFCPSQRMAVSIHAPAWGATGHEDLQGNRTGSFNSRSRVGSDMIDPDELPTAQQFQFTLPRGERL